MKIDVTKLNALLEKVDSGLAITNKQLISEEYNIVLAAVKAACATCNIFGDNITSIEFDETTHVLKINGIEVGGGTTPVVTTVEGVEGTLSKDSTLTMACETEGASIYYSTDGTVPTASTGTLYSDAIALTVSQTITAVAVKDTTSSPTPVVTVNRDADNDTLKATSAYPMYYTTNGTTPTESSLAVAAGTALVIEDEKTYKILSNGVIAEINCTTES